MGPSQTGLEMMGQHHQHVLQQHNPAQNKAPEDFQNQEAQNMGGMEQQAGVESLQFDYAGNQIQVDSSGTPVGLFDYSSQQQVCRKTKRDLTVSLLSRLSLFSCLFSSCSRGLTPWQSNSSLQLSSNSTPWLQPSSSISVSAAVCLTQCLRPVSRDLLLQLHQSFEWDLIWKYESHYCSSFLPSWPCSCICAKPLHH